MSFVVYNPTSGPTAELCLNRPENEIPAPKINLDNKTCLGYPDGNCLRQWPLQYLGL